NPWPELKRSLTPSRLKHAPRHGLCLPSGATILMRAQETTAYPLHWPLGFARTPAHRRQRARFSSRGDYSSKPLTIAQGRDRVLDELSRMTPVGQTWRVAGIVISTNLRTRTDGLPYSNARTPDDPGVATYFNLDGQPHC